MAVSTVNSNGHTRSATTDEARNTIATSGSVTLANNASTTITHAAFTRPLFVTGESADAGSGANSLLHLDGANGSTTIEDTGSSGLTWIAAGGAAKSTAQHKFGSASLAVSGGAYITTGANSAWLWTGDFTWETWVYPTTISGDYRAILCDSTRDHFNFLLTPAGALTLSINGNGSPILASANGVITTGSWQHVAICRNAGTLTFYVNGVSVASGSVGGNLGSSSLSWYIGYRANDGSHPFIGYFDEIALWSTEARYSGNFTPNTEAYADGSDSYVQLAHGVDFSVSRNAAGTQTTITNISGASFTATFYLDV